jgi:DNA polymerase-3 subunit epsilon
MALDFVALDVETANARRGSICSIGLAVVAGGQVVRTENMLCRPPGDLGHFDAFNTRIHGITSSKVANAQTFRERLVQMNDIIDGRQVVAHNAAFDINAILQACDAAGVTSPELDFACTLVLSKRILKHLVNYGLTYVCDDLGIPLIRHHDAAADAEACARIAIELARRCESGSIADLASSVNVKLGRLSVGSLDRCTGRDLGADGEAKNNRATLIANLEADPGHPFYGQVMVFTGALSLQRREAGAKASAVGATLGESVTKRTTILVIGDQFDGNSVADFNTGKAIKAKKLKADGQSIEIITEKDFFDML